MNWQERLKEKSFSLHQLDRDLIGVGLIRTYEAEQLISQLLKEACKEQREIDKKIAHKIADDCYNRAMVNHREVDILFDNASEPSGDIE